MSTPQTIIIPWSDIAADPGRLVREMEAGRVVRVEKDGTINYTVAPETSQLAADVQQYIDRLLAQFSTSQGLVPVEAIKQFLIQSFDEAEAEDMVSLRPKRTGVANTIFVSSGNPRHAPRIKIAVDPPDSFDPRGKNVAMQMQDNYEVVGDTLPPQRVIEQAKRWIKQNHAVLMRHWDNEISGDEVVELLKPLPKPLPGKKKRPASKKRPSSRQRPRRRT